MVSATEEILLNNIDDLKTRIEALGNIIKKHHPESEDGIMFRRRKKATEEMLDRYEAVLAEYRETNKLTIQ